MSSFFCSDCNFASFILGIFDPKMAGILTKDPKAPEVQDGSLMQNYV